MKLYKRIIACLALLMLAVGFVLFMVSLIPVLAIAVCGIVILVIFLSITGTLKETIDKFKEKLDKHEQTSYTMNSRNEDVN